MGRAAAGLLLKFSSICALTVLMARRKKPKIAGVKILFILYGFDVRKRGLKGRSGIQRKD